MAIFVKPSSASWVGPDGFYNGAQIQVRGTSGYYVLIGGSFTSYKYWNKGRISGGSATITLSPYTQYTSLELQIVLTDTNYSTSVTVGDSSKVYYLKLPRYAATVYYKGFSSSELFNSLDNPNLSRECSLTGWNLMGASIDSSRNGIYDAHMEYLNNWSIANGLTLYCIYSQDGDTSTSTKYYYRGNSTRQSVIVTEERETSFIYGRGVYEEGDVSVSYGSVTTSCAADSTYSFQGWATNSNTTNFMYTDYKQAYNAGYTTLYGVYFKSGGTATDTKYYYRGSNARQSVSVSTKTTDAYYYGTGQHDGGNVMSSTYGTVNTSCLSDSTYSFQGWSTSSSSSSVNYTDYKQAYNAGYTTLYGVYKKNESMTYYPQNPSGSASGVSVINYYYGTGTKTNNIPIEPLLSYADHILLGWSTTSSGSYKTWTEQWNNNVRTVYAIWQDTSSDDNNVYVGVNNRWIKGTVYYGVNGAWKQCVVKIGSNGEWK